MYVVISSHALAREVLADPVPGLCISAHRVARDAYPDRSAGTAFDGAMLVRALLQEADAPFIVGDAQGTQFPLALGNGDWPPEDEEALRVCLAHRLLAAPDRRLALPTLARDRRGYARPSYIETC